jgi:hypothetical protein
MPNTAFASGIIDKITVIPIIAEKGIAERSSEFTSDSPVIRLMQNYYLSWTAPPMATALHLRGIAMAGIPCRWHLIDADLLDAMPDAVRAHVPDLETREPRPDLTAQFRTPATIPGG